MTKQKRENPLNLPRQEDILGRYDLGGKEAVVVEITDENRGHLARLSVWLMLEGQVCKFCNQEFTEIEDVVFAGKNERGDAKFAHGLCWQNSGPERTK